VYAGGGFRSIGGSARHGIAALDATTGRATVWNPYAETNYENVAQSVDSLALSGSTVYAGGDFGIVAFGTTP